MRRLLFICGLFLALALAGFGETLPPKPAQYFNDFAKVVSPQTAAGLNARLEQFERDTSNQILVAIYPKMDSESSVQDYTFRIAEAWGIGQKEKNNGAALFVFVADHHMFIQVGYGLEGALPDAICKRIVSDEIGPALKAGNFDAGLTAGVDSMIKATRGEYKGTGGTAGRASHGIPLGTILTICFFVFIFIMQIVRSRRGTVYGSSGSGFATGLLWGLLGSMSNSGGGYRGEGGSGGGGGGGGFSGGGGSFGGGGAGGDW